jgi:MFS family permease
VTAEEGVLAATIFFSGLAAGLLGMLCTIMRPMLKEMDGPGFRTFMEAFLRFADRAWGLAYNLAWSLGMFLGPILALVLLRDDPGSTAFVLTAIGLGIVLVGVIIVSNVWKTPHYKVMLAWKPEAMPPDWEAGREKYFTINWIQLVTTWSAFALFLLALTSL